MQIIVLNLSTDENNTVLGFTTKWIESLSNNFSEIFVITMQEGKHCFNNKVKVFEIRKGNFRILTFYKNLRIAIKIYKNSMILYIYMLRTSLN